VVPVKFERHDVEWLDGIVAAKTGRGINTTRSEEIRSRVLRGNR
jgi:hypothetical protein